MGRAAAVLVLAACQPGPVDRPDRCDPDPPAPGAVRVGRVDCDARLIPGGDGRTRDWWLANAWMRVVVRDPTDALSLPGVGGLTLVDVAPWGTPDVLYEAAPLVHGGWLDIDDVELLPDGLRATGVVRGLPFRRIEAEGAPATVTWRIDPDGPFLTAEGAAGFWLHPSPDVAVLDGVLVADTVVAHDGLVEDLGGALVVTGDRLVIATASEAWGWLGPTVDVAGSAPGATALTAFAGDVPIARVPIADAFTAALPARTTGVRAEAAGRAPSPVVAPGPALDLRVGDAGTVALALTWNGRPRHARVDYAAPDRAGALLVDPSGGALDVGAGPVTVTVSAGPAWLPVTTDLVVPVDGELPVPVTLSPRFDPGDRVLAALRWPGERSRTWRGSDVRSLRTAAAVGLDLAVITPEDDVASGSGTDGDVWRRNGSLLTHPDGWTVSAWRWTADTRGAHGAPSVAALSPEDALAAATGGPGTDRFTAVDLPWLAAAGPPVTVDPQPDFVWLDAPPTWDAWTDWLDASVDLVPVAAFTWVDVIDPERASRAEIEQALVRGHVCAGSGGLVVLTVGGVGSGELSPGGAVHVAVRSGPIAFDRVRLFDAAGLLVDLPVDGHADLDPDVVPTGGWVFAVADGPGAWAVTGPVWLGATRPGDG